MAPKIRADLEGVVYARTEDDVLHTLVAGDDVPDGVVVGDHVLDERGSDDEAGAGEPTKPAATAPKAEWLAYAEHLGLDLDGSETTPRLKDKVAEHEAPTAQGA